MLLFNGGEILKITDMGLSKVIGEESMTATQGTMKYMSPGDLLFMILLKLFYIHITGRHKTKRKYRLSGCMYAKLNIISYSITLWIFSAISRIFSH